MANPIYIAMHYNKTTRNYRQIAMFTNKAMAEEAARNYKETRIGKMFEQHHIIYIEKWRDIRGRFLKEKDWSI